MRRGVGQVGAGRAGLRTQRWGGGLSLTGFRDAMKTALRSQTPLGRQVASSYKTHPPWSSTGWPWGAGWATPLSTLVATPEGAQVRKLRLREARPLPKVPRLGQKPGPS